jgi:hypothetical protein
VSSTWWSFLLKRCSTLFLWSWTSSTMSCSGKTGADEAVVDDLDIIEAASPMVSYFLFVLNPASTWTLSLSLTRSEVLSFCFPSSLIAVEFTSTTFPLGQHHFPSFVLISSPPDQAIFTSSSARDKTCT